MQQKSCSQVKVKQHTLCNSGHCAHLNCSVGRTERSALKVLREQLFAHKSDLIGAFKKFDSNNTGASRVTDRLSPLGFRCWFLFYYGSPAFRPSASKVRVTLWRGNVSSRFCPPQGRFSMKTRHRFTTARPAVSQKLLFKSVLALTQRVNSDCARLT